MPSTAPRSRPRLTTFFAALLAFLVLFRPEAEPPPAGELVPTPISVRLPVQEIIRFAPLVYLHPDERYQPMSAEEFLARSSLEWRGGGILASEFTRPFDELPFRVVSKSQGFYLELDDAARPGAGPRAPAYFEARRLADGSTSIFYWLFFGFSQPNTPGPDLSAFGHEGDWEGLEVVLGGSGLPSEVRYHEHSLVAAVPWSDVCKARHKGQEDCSASEGHPIAYSARGSHASYSATGTVPQCLGTTGPKKYLCLDDESRLGPQWRTWENPLLPAAAQPWYGFGGAWGHAGRDGDTTGPLGPSFYKICPPLSQLAGRISDCISDTESNVGLAPGA
jgi:Vacuolar protein sorting-associated protein 62